MNNEKVDTYINFSENELGSQQFDEQDVSEKVDTCSNFSEDDPDSQQSDERDVAENVTDVLSKFIHRHYFEIEKFQELLRKVKEYERNKIRFGIR